MATRSFDPTPSATITGPRGQLVHRDTFQQSERMERRLYTVRPGVWCLVGNGLSNQTFIDAPDGLIAIDTGESIEEMQSALAEIEAVSSRPVAAVIYTHFHYAAGTAALPDGIPVHGHRRIAINLARITGEIAPVYSRGLVHQFATALPPDGPDGIVGVGLGNLYRNPDHAPFTPGHRPVTEPFEGGERLTIAGLEVEVTSAPSDADDSVTLWFPQLRVAVHNILWPTLFNVYAIRGEEYRDPRILLRGLDHLHSLGAEHLVGAHGPPLSGVDEIDRRVTRYRDSIQYLWDQTVRAMNRGLTDGEIAATVRLPDLYDDDYLTSEFYGVAEHHVRQIACGLRGWFDGDATRLFPLPPAERAARLIAGFGGPAEVRAQAVAALEGNDLRWALELAGWMVARADADVADRQLLADCLRAVGQRTTAANIRNWCLTRARHLDGSGDLSRLYLHRLRPAQVKAMGPAGSANVLRVLVDPDRAAGVDGHVALRIGDADVVGLHVRNGVSVVTDGSGAAVTLHLGADDWAALLSGGERWADLAGSGRVRVEGDQAVADRVLACYDFPAQRPGR